MSDIFTSGDFSKYAKYADLAAARGPIKDILDKAKEVARRIHEKYEDDKKEPTGNQNCLLCSWCAEAMLRGIDILPRPVYSPRDPALEITPEDMLKGSVEKRYFKNFNDMQKWYLDQHNARFYVHVKWSKGNGGHEFLLLNTNVPHVLDAQQGLFSPVVDLKTFKEYLCDIDYNETYMCRIDNHDLDIENLKQINNDSAIVAWDEEKDIQYMKDHDMMSDDDEQYAKDHGMITDKENYTMRDATESDLEFVYQSELETVGENKDDPKVQRYIRKDAKESLGHTKIIVVDGKDAGVYQAYATNYYGLREGERDWWYLAHIYLKPEYRSKGIGSSIIKKDMSEHDKILLQVMKSNTKAKKLYESLGFVVDMENDHGGLVMRYDRSKVKQEDDMVKGYRFSYKGIGIYEALKKEMFKQTGSSKAWIEFKDSDACSWLPVPPSYGKDNESYFTKDGYDMFKKKTLPIVKKYIPDYDETQMEIPKNAIIYEDEYQFVINTSKVKQESFQEGHFEDDELLSVLKNSKYGVAYHGKLITNPSEQDYINKWHCLSPNEFIDVGGGVCYDFVEWESDYLKKHHIPFKKFHISYHIGFDKTDVGKDAATHSICVAIVNNKYMYIEGSSKKLAKAMGYIKEFNNIDELLDFAVKHTLHEPEQSKLIIIDYTNVDNLIGLNLFDYQNKIFSKGKVIQSDFIQEMELLSYVQEGASQDIRNGVNPNSKKLFFHVSSNGGLDGQVFKPRVPDYLDEYDPEDKCFENTTTPRVCFSQSIEGCINAIAVNFMRINPIRFEKLYVYIPEKPINEYRHKTNKEIIRDKDVFDANVTREMWILEPVRLKLYGVILIDQWKKVHRKSTVPTVKNEKDTRPYYTIKWHWLVKPKVVASTEKSQYKYDTSTVCRNLGIDLKKFKYGLIRDGRLITHDNTAEDYEKYWRYHTGEEVDQAGGGNCYDMVEYEGGYLDAYGVPYKKYYLAPTYDDKYSSHTFIVVPNDGKFIYIEKAFKMVSDQFENNKKEFDSLDDVFDFLLENICEYERLTTLNYIIIDYTDIEFKSGTDIKHFRDYILNHGDEVREKKYTLEKKGK